jgi:hypothetical protein
MLPHSFPFPIPFGELSLECEVFRVLDFVLRLPTYIYILSLGTPLKKEVSAFSIEFHYHCSRLGWQDFTAMVYIKHSGNNVNPNSSREMLSIGKYEHALIHPWPWTEGKWRCRASSSLLWILRAIFHLWNPWWDHRLACKKKKISPSYTFKFASRAALAFIFLNFWNKIMPRMLLFVERFVRRYFGFEVFWESKLIQCF